MGLETRRRARKNGYPSSSGFVGIDCMMCGATFRRNSSPPPRCLQECEKTIGHIKAAMEQKRPIFGICLGNQLLAIAAGCTTYKMR